MGLLDSLFGTDAASSEDLETLLQLIRDAGSMPEIRNIDQYINPQARLVVKACEQIGRLAARGIIGIPDIPRLLQAARGTNGHVEGSMAQALANMGPRVIPHLIKLLDAPDEIARVAAAALGFLGADALPQLEAVVRSDNRARRKMAIGAISIMRSTGMPTLVQLLGDPDQDVRLKAAIGIAHQVSTESSVESHEFAPGSQALLSALENPDLRVSESAAFGLGLLGGSALAKGMLRLPYEEMFDGITDDRLLEQPAAEIADDLEALTYPSPEVRRSAAWRLGEFGDPIAIPFLFQTVLDDPDQTPRAAKMWALWRLAKTRYII
ncbi:HEAT repeat domain-containing protein [Nitrolancea hollandica]|uniref:PBS lyase HEAT domain protein repeat-containing protein n=1 Tax=Nitrolancea hollandica Lb TaxID=1129897 RepID=I4EGI9_9BACT|nr:HEAT repeat domain-containing protein [Nitrolancea hollandica]CCF83801.1 hypothetical protein NITHO_2730002 [Nitrolancea hollandica Lb]